MQRVSAQMLTVGCNDHVIPGTPCDHGTPLTTTEEYSQMSLWCLFASNLMLGSDLRNISNTTLAIIGNAEALAVNRDPLGAHGRLVYDHTSPPPPLWSPSLTAVGALSCAVGALSPGEFLLVANMTLMEADKYCISNKTCGGFTTRSNSCNMTGPNASRVHEVYFKTDIQAQNGDARWRTFKKPNYVPPPPPPRVQVFAKPLASGSCAVVILNRGPATIDAELKWEMLKLNRHVAWTAAKVRDIWTHADLGSFVGSFTVHGLESHAAAFLIVTQTA